jgi:FkbM family methyltransferase
MLKDFAKAKIPERTWERIATLKRRISWKLLRLRRSSSLSPIELFRRDGYSDLITKDLGLEVGSEVWDFGGYLGDWSAIILYRYGCSIKIFEPVPAFAEKLRARFVGSDRISIRQYGVELWEGSRYFQTSGDGTGAFGDGQQVEVAFRSAFELASAAPKVVSLMAVNIEGGEYELIPALAEAALLDRINTILIQFHKVGEEWERERNRCKQILGKTHTLDWEYPFVWEKWSRKSLS